MDDAATVNDAIVTGGLVMMGDAPDNRKVVDALTDGVGRLGWQWLSGCRRAPCTGASPRHRGDRGETFGFHYNDNRPCNDHLALEPSSEMLRVAYCGHIGLADADDTIRTLIERCAANAGFDETTVSGYGSPLDLIDAVTGPKSRECVDMAIVGLNLPGISGIELVLELRNEGFDQHLVLCAENHEDALDALRMHVDGYLVPPIHVQALAPILEHAFSRIWEHHARSVVLHTREGTRRIPISQLLFSETVEHDQRIHLADGTCLSMRISSRALFELLADNSSFFKAGSSYIVNVRAIRHVDPRGSTAMMRDGTMIPIPVRLRKTLEDAILSNG